MQEIANGINPSRMRFHLVMGGCGLFVLAMLGSLAYVCSRPQTADVQHAERYSVQACWQRSADESRSSIYRSEQRKACREMEKQYVYKFQQQP